MICVEAWMCYATGHPRRASSAPHPHAATLTVLLCSLYNRNELAPYATVLKIPNTCTNNYSFESALLKLAIQIVSQ